MKKYLMTGVAAVAMCAAFTSCSKNEDLYDPGAVREMEIAEVYEQYNRAFIKTFGQVNPNQDWGFGSNFGKVGTRGVFANGNEWAANDRDDCKYKVPPALTEPQMNIVRIYFQNKPKPDYEDPHWTEYFIQQVYKGGVDATKIGPNSPEKYKAADGQTDIIGSDHMDHLAAIDLAAIDGEFVDHNNNFNHGDCGVYGNVLNYKGNLTTVEETYPVNSGDDKRHADKINLMTNSTTASFGYYNSNSSVRRTEYTGLVSWQTIKAWADANGHAGEADCLNDGWNRSFMGFDFEMMVGPEIYAKNGDGSIKYLTYGDLPDSQYAWDGVSTYGGSRPAASDFVTDSEGNKIPVLDARTNMYAGTNGDIDQNQLITSHSCLSGYQYNQETQQNDLPYYQNQNCLNTKVLFDKVDAGYCLVDGSKGCKWVKVGGTADGYYSDWIVTLTKAEKYTTTPPPSGYDVRIMAEDLNATAADGDIENSDWDFNDVVFDVKFDATGDGATIRLVAAGGVLPLYVAGHEVHAEFGEGIKPNGEYPMINTGAGPQKDYVTFRIESGADRANKGQAIPITVEKKLKDGTTQTFALTAKQGQPAAKFAVPTTTQHLGERVHIDFGSGGAFSRGVENGSFIWW